MQKNLSFIPLFVLAVIMLGCGENRDKMTIDEIATGYVKLVLQVGQYDGDFVDAYFGPDALKPETELSEDAQFPVEEFMDQCTALEQALADIDVSQAADLVKTRIQLLQKQLMAVKTKVAMLGGSTFSFDEEAMMLYDAEPPHIPLDTFDVLLSNLDQLLAGEGSLQERYQSYSQQFIIPTDKLDAVFQAAIQEARIRTNQHYDLPADENFVVEYVNDKSWSGYNYYQGDGQSLIQLNTDFPIYIERAIDLACHEGYPGHHVFNALLEKNLVIEKGWVEYSVYPLFSPQSLIAEGSANYGIDVAFPGEERLVFDKTVLYPIAGIDTSLADTYHQIQQLRSRLNYAGNEAARSYLNGDITREQAAQMLEKYLLYEPDRALQRTRFFDQYRSYVINYNLGLDLVADYIERRGGTADNPEKRWQLFGDLLSLPLAASMIQY